MAEKIFNGRLQLKIDTHDNWVANKSFVLKSGEVAFDVVSVKDPATSQYVPAVMAKVGDGTSTWEQLKYMYAPAADVYSWAKGENKPVYSADEITGIDTKIADYVSNEMGIEVDTDTQYTITKVNDYQYKLMSKSKGDTNFATQVAVIDIPNDTAAITALQNLVGDTAVTTQITNAIAALKLADTYEAKGTAATEAAKVLGSESDDATKDTVYGAKAAAKAAQDDADALAAKVGTVADGKTVTQMIDDAKTAATYDDTALKTRVATLEGSDAGKSARAIAAEETAKIVAGADTAYDTLKEVSDWISSHKTDAASMNSAILALEAIVDGIGGDGEKATVVEYVADAIAALKIGDYAKAADLTALAARVTTLEGKAHEHANKAELDKFATGDKAALDKAVTDISDLKTSKANDADLAAIAKSGNVKDLAQTDGDIIVFNCGSATVNV